MDSERLRIAIVSTPRSGNCWLRHMLASALDLTELAVDQAADPRMGLAWETLPERAIVPMHWLPEDEFQSILARHDFKTVVIARHPLDVLLSILAFSQHDESTLRWLAGAGGDERCIQAASPLGDAFLTYATGPRAAALLSVSAAWWQHSEACRVHYEDLINDTRGALEKILTALGATARRPLAEVIEKSSPDAMRSMQVEWLYHIWQRQPGSWKRLLTPAAAQRICDAHAAVMSRYGYVCDADESLDAAAAQQTWERMDAAAVKRNVNGVKKVLAQSEASRRSDRAQVSADLHSLAIQVQPLTAQTQEIVAQARQVKEQLQQIAALTAALDAAQAQHQRDLQQHRAELACVTQQLQDLPWRQIRELGELGPWSFSAARRLQRWSKRFPRVASSFKSFVLRLRSMKLRWQ